jgi:hypothetical protein
MSVSLLPFLRDCSIDRHNRASSGLKDGTLRVTLVSRSPERIDALVKSGSQVYEVSLTDAHHSCTCPDASFRVGVICKHVLSTVVSCLANPHQQADCIHLARADGTILCGEQSPARVWYRPSDSVSHWKYQVCPTCLAQRLQPASLTRDEHYFSQAQAGRAA